MGACYWSVMLKDFKFLNAAPKAWQAKQMYDIILLNARNTRFDDLIWERPRRPYPKIIIRFYIGKVLYESTLEFMSADKDAQGILSWEGDWLNLEEAGLMDNLEEVIINTGSRLRGQVRGRSRLGRFSMISNSWDNYHLWYYFDQASGDPENFLSIAVSTRHNKNVTPEQFKRMLMRIQNYNPATPYVEQQDSGGVITQYASIVYYATTNKVYLCTNPSTGNAPTDEDYWNEVTDLSTIIDNTNIEINISDTYVNAQAAQCVSNAFSNIAGCGCDNKENKKAYYLNGLMIAADSAVLQGNYNDMERYIREVESLCLCS
jgi:hypothetical protein